MKKHQIQFGRKIIRFVVVRSVRRKKTFSVVVEPSGKVLVKAPNHAPFAKIIDTVKSKAGWILEKLKNTKVENGETKKEFVSGESFLYCGRHVRLKVLKKSGIKEPIVRMYHGRLEVIVKEKKRSAIREAVTQWYVEHAEKRIPERVSYYARKMGVKEPVVVIRDQQKRWGSCDKKGVLRFNWRIVMAPISLLDYVVVHELCHIKNLNHSAVFWKCLRMILPDYEQRKEHLGIEGKLYQL